MPFDDLNRAPQIVIDEAVREELGDKGRYRGPQGYLRRQVDEANEAYIDEVNRISKKWLSGPMGTENNNPAMARIEYKKAVRQRRARLYGNSWNQEKRRMEGGLYDKLYPEEREIPEPGDKGYLVFLWGQTFDQATDEKGEIDFDKLNILQNEFWEMVPSNEEAVDAVLENIRLLEPQFDDRMQNMLDAGRYAGTFSLRIQGVETSYFELEKHPFVLDYVSRATGYSVEEIRQYQSLSSAERNAVGGFPKERAIASALSKARRSGGILKNMRLLFVNSAPGSWKQAMYEAGYEHENDGEMRTAVRLQTAAGRELPSLEYYELYVKELSPDLPRGIDYEPEWGRDKTVLWPGITRRDELTYSPAGPLTKQG